MKRILRVGGLLTAALLVAFLSLPKSASAQEGHQHAHEPSVNFTVSCNARAQRQFNHAVAWLHSFEYEEAEKAFTEVAVTDPRCGKGYCGLALSGYHPLWAPPTAADLQKGSSAMEKPKAAGARTRRERDYIRGLEVFYQDSDKLDHKARTFAYSEAMKQLYQRHRSDDEAGVFYSVDAYRDGDDGA